ncbi:hypothetical protein HD599_001044 [Conyzicola lurida]|uniref:VWFA domain-containing protein n=1 Tax=Conyzicola lurida TaxID=1172621 RepID=A0A841ALW3_9MICO|nr:hypothetical protein [Conyzicola lurida]
MELILWWLIPVWIAVVAAVVVAVVLLQRRRRRETAADSLPIAHRDRLTALPGYARALRRYRTLLLGVVASLAVVLVAAVGLTARPATVASVQPELSNRDIVLCLDISGSMVEYDKEVLDVFVDLAKEFTGERISLVVFNASAVTRFPLTSDYSYVEAQLTELRAEFDAGEDEFYRGTLFGNGSSLVGDGLASCAVRFDSPDADRSRSVILVTDNLIAGEPIFTLQQAGALATERGVRVYGINPGDTEAKAYMADLAEEFRSVVETTDGAYYALEDPDAIPSIVSEITAQQADAIDADPEFVLTDQPGLLAILAFLGLGAFFVLAWRVKR